MNRTPVNPQSSTRRPKRVFVKVIHVLERTEHRPRRPEQVTAESSEIWRPDEKQSARHERPRDGRQRGARIEQVLDRVEHHGGIERLLPATFKRFRRLPPNVQSQPLARELRGLFGELDALHAPAASLGALQKESSAATNLEQPAADGGPSNPRSGAYRASNRAMSYFPSSTPSAGRYSFQK